MSVIWIAGLLGMILIGFFFALALCRCAVLADRDVEQYLSEVHQASAHPIASEQEA